MPISCGKKFLYSRIAIIIATMGWMLFLYAGVRGFSFWHGGFAVFFWLAFGLLNYPVHSSFWLAVHRVSLFLPLYGTLVVIAVLVEQFGFGARMWFYPAYQGWLMLLTYGVLYPLGGLSMIEIVYFLAHFWGEPLAFDDNTNYEQDTNIRKHPALVRRVSGQPAGLTPCGVALKIHAKWRGLLDVCEHALLFFMFMIILASIAGIAKELSVSLAAVAAILWLIVALVRLRFHIQHHGHYALIIALAVALAALSRAFPILAMREWIYLSAPFADFFNMLMLGVPVWQWLGSFLSVLVPFRVWLVFMR